MRSRSNWKVLTNCDAEVVIKDLNTSSMSVTNDAENVVFDLYDRGALWHGKRLLYFDSNGDLDEIVHEHGRFVDFRILSEAERSGRA